MTFLSTLSLRRATRIDKDGHPALYISIHALLAESDGSTAAVVVVVWVFLSTLSLRRATAPDNLSEYDIMHFYPRSPCGERHCDHTIYRKRTSISIHALLAESDRHRGQADPAGQHFYPRSPCGERQNLVEELLYAAVFLSTLSLRRATASRRPQGLGKAISIHALLAESDEK